MTEQGHARTDVLMGTLVTIRVFARAGEPDPTDSIARAFQWFREIEACCSRFDPSSEVMRLATRAGEPVVVSPILLQAVQFAVFVAEETGGAFDPTIGADLERRGFNREYRTGALVQTALPSCDRVTYRDVHVDSERHTIALDRPLIFDLGAVAKGLAIDTAARELAPYASFIVDAGGDLYLGGRRPDGALWRVGIRDPRQPDSLLDAVRVASCAVCTSGSYERGAHIVDPRAAAFAHRAASVTVVAPSAMLADAVGTAAFVLGPAEGMQLFDRVGVDGLIVSPTGERFATRGMYCDYHLGAEAPAVAAGDSEVLSNTQGAPHDRLRGAAGARRPRGGRPSRRPRPD